jgi:predicted O-methyltransferase YrrM
MMLRRFALVSAALALTVAGLLAQDASPNAVPAEIASILREIRAADTGLLAVSEEDGRFLRMMAHARQAKRALEIGAANGYSAIWIGLALRQTGGRLVTIEYDPVRAKTAAANIRRAGLNDIVQVIEGDAFKEIPRLQGGFDYVFLDAWKPDYRKFFDLVRPRLDTGGLFLAHNVVNKRSEMQDFLAAIQTDPAFVSAVVSPGSEGMSISVKVK